MAAPRRPMTASRPPDIVLAVLDEPPFCWVDGRGEHRGCDVVLARRALALTGVGDARFVQTSFGELLPGLGAGRWRVTTPIFVTPERARLVQFSRTVWRLGDGLVVRRGDAEAWSSYAALAADARATLAVVEGQVQRDAARAAGVPSERMLICATQVDTINAVLDGHADAAASTAIGNRALVARIGDERIIAVDLASSARAAGAFAWRHDDPLVPRFDQALEGVLDDEDHRTMMGTLGFREDEIG